MASDIRGLAVASHTLSEGPQPSSFSRGVCSPSAVPVRITSPLSLAPFEASVSVAMDAETAALLADGSLQGGGLSWHFTGLRQWDHV